MVGNKRSNRGHPRPTIEDVAREAGVSTGTVSRVLNDRPGVRPATRERVNAAIARLRYRPDQAARELSIRQGTRIGLHISGNRRLTPFYMYFLEQLLEQLANDGFRLEEIPSGADGLPAHLTDVMLLFGLRDDDARIPFLQARGVPTVVLGHAPGVRFVVPDDHDGGRQATRHLLQLGHRRIAHLSGSLDTQAAFDRYRGYRDALDEANVPFHDELLLDSDFSTLSGYRTVRRACEQGLDFSALFAASDELAVGAIAALEDVGRRVPTDVSVIGFDDLPEIGETLTTIRQDVSRITAVAVALAKEALRGEAVRHEVVPVQLIQRGTTARRR